MKCKYCNSINVVKAGIKKRKTIKPKQQYKCNDCNRSFVIGNDRYKSKLYSPQDIEKIRKLWEIFIKDYRKELSEKEKKYPNKYVSLPISIDQSYMEFTKQLRIDGIKVPSISHLHKLGIKV